MATSLRRGYRRVLGILFVCCCYLAAAGQTATTVPIGDVAALATAGKQTEAQPLSVVSRSTEAQASGKSSQGEGAEPVANHREALSSTASRATVDTTTPFSEFQAFVSSSLGRGLAMYGQSLFDHVPSTFAPVDRIPVTADYVIGPGDELLIRAWGQIDLDVRVVVDRAGAIFLPKVGSVSVAGITYQQLPEALKSAVARVFRNFDLTVNLGQLRSIQIFLVGQARRPGSYTVSSLSTLVNALFASGGPSATGSMRRILLKRDSRLVTEFDLYDLLLRGDKAKDVRLLPGDVIYIPPVGPLVALAGSVNVPAIFELKETATLEDAIALAGGLTSTASSQKVTFERIEKHATRKVEEFAPLDIALGRELKDGDLIRVFSLSPRFENAVTLRGNVAMPGRYQWHAGLRIRDLIPDRSALITPDYWQRNNLSATASVQVSRSVPEVNWDYAVVQRLNSADLSSRLIPFNLGKAVLDNDPENNILLEVGDVITVFSQGDLAVPLERRTKFVRLEGEFRAAGVYRVEAGETLRQLVKRAGGLTPTAYLYGAEFTRESARLQQQKGLDEFVRNLDQELARNSVAPLGTSAEEAKEMAMRLQAERQLIDKLRQAKAAGRLVLELKAQASGLDALPDLELEDGDSLLIPHRPAAVSVLGAVYNRNSFLYRSNRRVSHYLELAGGPTRDADKGRMFVLRADGSVLSKQSLGGGWWSGSRFSGLRLMPGDAVVVPERLNRGTGWRAVRDWSLVFSQFALGAAAISVIR